MRVVVLIVGLSFRPLDGESISKLIVNQLETLLNLGFRPLDGESISKLSMKKNLMNDAIKAVSVP